MQPQLDYKQPMTIDQENEFRRLITAFDLAEGLTQKVLHRRKLKDFVDKLIIDERSIINS